MSYFLMGLFGLFLVIFFVNLSFLYMLDTRLCQMQIAAIFSHSAGCLFTLLIVPFAVKRLFGLTKSRLSIFAFVAIAFGVFVMKSLPLPMS